MKQYDGSEEQVKELQLAYAVKVYDGRNLPIYFINSDNLLGTLNMFANNKIVVHYEILSPLQLEELMT